MKEYSREKILSLSTRDGVVNPSSYLLFASAKGIETKGHSLGSISFLSSELHKFLPVKSENKNDYTKKLEIRHLRIVMP